MRPFLLPFLGVAWLLFMSSAVRSADDDARAILDKAIKAHGGLDKLGKEKATQSKSKGTIELAGGVKFTEETFVQPNRFKSVLDLEVANMNIKVLTVYNGDKAWVQVQGQTKELDGKLLEEIKEAAYLVSLGNYGFLKDKNYEVKSLGELKVNERPAVGVQIATKGHRDVNLFFDKETGLMAKMERQTLDPMTEKDVAEERIITEYQEKDGVKVAKKALINREGKKYIEVEIEEVKFRDKFDESEFAKP